MMRKLFQKHELDMFLFLQIARHGARTPVDTYPNDPHINDTFYPVGWGQLTNVSILNRIHILIGNMHAF